MNYVRNAWYVAAWSDEMEIARPFAITIMGDPLVLYRTDGNRIVALADRCAHRFAPLSLGRCEGTGIRCMYHGLLFNAEGKVIEIPGQDTIPPRAGVRAYPAVERHSWIWIWMGDPELADEALIPPAIGLEHPDYVLGHGTLDYEAEARLINDNLLDFSHLAYVHGDSFGATTTWATTRARVTPLDRGVRIEWWLTDQPGAPARADRDRLRDRWQTYDFLVPGVMLMTGGGGFPSGTAEALGYATPDLSTSQEGVTFTNQAVTPMTEATARYFFSWGPHVSQGGERERDLLMGMAHQAFAEDRVMIEGQQKIVNLTRGVNIMPRNGDKAITIFNRILERMIRQEGRSARDCPTE